ncbi:hypothetical protein [Thiospirillum jenense]|uniref:hypothetical protein n=1 Tax=Thiospirillum jenense TaxID=1653858 RepID=UPI0015F991E4|nr:hypothetical protein [Thiospirillum jenense]
MSIYHWKRRNRSHIFYGYRVDKIFIIAVGHLHVLLGDWLNSTGLIGRRSNWE